MPQSRRPVWQRYGAALVFVTVALALKLLLVPLVTRDQPALLFIAAVTISAAFGGFGPGLLAILLGAACDSYFFMQPYGQFRLNSPDEVFRLVIFFVEGVFISVICARMKWARALAVARAAEAHELQQRVLEISDSEQRRLGHDLHDGLGQHLTGMALLARRFQERLATIAPGEANEAKTLATLAQGAVEWTHDLCRTMSPSMRDAVDLPQALEELAAKAENLFSIKCTFERTGTVQTTDLATAGHLYRIAQEAISNAVRHGRAKHVRLRLDYADAGLTMEITDDGTGINSTDESAQGMGLRIMRYRAKVIGASIEIRHHETGGTGVTCRCPSAADAKTKAAYGIE